MKSASQKTWSAVSLVLLAVLMLIFAMFSPKTGVTADGIAYMNTASHIANGDGVLYSSPDAIERPFVLWPPLYPVILAPAKLLGVSVYRWAGVVNSLLFAFLSIGSFLLMRSTFGIRAGVIAGILVPFTGLMPEIFNMAYSEPLFLVLQLAWLAAVLRAGTGGYRQVVLAGFITSIMILTRYAGAAFVLAGIVAIRLSSPAKENRPFRTMAFTAVACLPVIAWIVRNSIIGGSPVERSLAASFRVTWLLDVWRLSTLWLLPAEVSRWVRHGLLLSSAMLWVAWLYRARRIDIRLEHSSCRFVYLCSLSIIAYIVFLAAATFLFTREPTLDLRMLAPAHLPAMLIVSAALAHVISSQRKHVQIAGILFTAALLGANVWRTVQFSIIHQNEGIYYSSQKWEASQLLESTQLIPDGAAVASNHSEFVYWSKNNPCIPLPANSNSSSAEIDEKRKQRFLESVGNRDCYILLFDKAWSWDVREDVLIKELNLIVVQRTNDGVLLRTKQIGE